MAWRSAVVCVIFYLCKAAKGELVLVRSPVCPGDSAVYRCNVTGSGLTWSWNPGSSTSPRFTVISGFTPPGVNNLTILNTLVQFDLTIVGPPYTINVIATIFNPQQLNGIMMDCNMQELTIDIPPVMNLVPSALTVELEENRSSIIRIYPKDDGNIDGIEYELSGGTRMMVTTPISVNASKLINITFFHCKNSSEFYLDVECLLANENMGYIYTFFINGTWEISRRCGIILVICNSNGNWSEDISCPQVATTIDSTLNSGEGIVTSREEDRVTSTRKAEENKTSNSSCSSEILSVLIGSIIATFVLAYLLGNTAGVLCGAFYTRRKWSERNSAKKIDVNSNKDLSKGPLYEDVKIDKHVELLPNISYDTVKNVGAI